MRLFRSILNRIIQTDVLSRLAYYPDWRITQTEADAVSVVCGVLMNIEIHEVPLEGKPVLKELMDQYLAELVPYSEDVLDIHDPLEYRYFDLYWSEPNRLPLFVLVDGRLAGFALIRTQVENHIAGGEVRNSIAEFFIIPSFRLQRIGETIATQIFNTYPGKWMIAQLAEHNGAQMFWRTIIHRYTQGRYKEVFHNDQHWYGPVQHFDNTTVTPQSEVMVSDL